MNGNAVLSFYKTQFLDHRCSRDIFKVYTIKYSSLRRVRNKSIVHIKQISRSILALNLTKAKYKKLRIRKQYDKLMFYHRIQKRGKIQIGRTDKNPSCSQQQ